MEDSFAGKTFGNWKVVEIDKGSGTKARKYHCECQCEAKIKKSVRLSSLTKGISTSCGCKTSEVKAQTLKARGFVQKANDAGKAALRVSSLKRKEDAAKELIGQKFNFLTVTNVINEKVECLCDCGKVKVALRSDVKAGKTSSCGCQRGARLRSNRKDWQIPWVGEKFGMLTILKEVDGYRCLAECECKVVKEFYIGNLTNGDIKSCGCESGSMRASTNLTKYGSETISVNVSKGEKELREWIESLGLVTSRKNIKLKTGAIRELDIVVETLKIAFEFNGAYFHSDSFIKDNHHVEKTEGAGLAGYRLIHVFDFEWSKRKNAVKSYIRSALGKNTIKVAARKCEVREIGGNEAALFLDAYHLLGAVPASFLGCYYNNELLAVAAFRKHHVTNKEYTLARWCVKENVSIQGGLSKVMSKAKGILKLEVDKIISWADLRVSEAKGYLKSGWVAEAHVKPDYFYFNPKNKEVVYKYRRRKSLMNTPEGMTETEHAKQDGLYKIWDCGKVRLSYKLK